MNDTGNVFVTSKYYKDNVMDHPTVRLVHPSINDIGRISKHTLDQANIKLVSKVVQMNGKTQ